MFSVSISIKLHVKRQDPAHRAFLVNGLAFQPPPVPVLLQILSGARKASELLPSGVIYGLEPNKSVELAIPAGVLGGPVSCCSHSPIPGPRF